MRLLRSAIATLALVLLPLAAHGQTLGNVTTTAGKGWTTVYAPDINDDFTKLYGTPVLTIGNQTIWSNERGLAVAGCVSGTDAGAGNSYTIGLVSACINAALLGTDSVSADELNATGVESELEAVLDLQDLQGAVVAGQLTAIDTSAELGSLLTDDVAGATKKLVFLDTPADDQVPVGDSASATTWRTLPDSDGATQKLQYDQATNAFSAGTDDDVPESGDFTNLTGGQGIANSSGTLNLKYTDTLGGNPAFGANECVFVSATAGGGVLCEGSVADNFEGLFNFPNVTGADSTQQVITDATAASGDLTGTYPSPTVAANSVALTTDTTGNYAAGDAEAGNALTGDSATAFFSTGSIEVARGGNGGAPAGDDQTFVSTSTTAGAFITLPDSDGATQKLQYDQGTNTFSAGTDDDVPEVGDFSALVGGSGIDNNSGTLDLDLTEISSATFGAGSFTAMVFDAGATDPTFTFGSNSITVSNAATFSLGTSAAFTTGTIEVGAATDTTLQRSSAGVLAVEGVVIPTVSSTNTLTNKTLTSPVLDGTISGTAVATGATASKLTLRDANANESANSFIAGYSTTATAAGTTTLTVASTQMQFFTGSTTQTVTMPVVSTLVLGQQWWIVNQSSGTVTVQSSGSNTILAVAAGNTGIYTVVSTSGTTAASWQATYISSGGGTGTVTSVGTGTGLTGGAVTTTGTISFDYSDAGASPSLNADETRFTSNATTPGYIVFEGDTQDAFEGRIHQTDPTADRVMTIPNADSNPVQPATCSGGDYVSGISSAGVITCSHRQESMCFKLSDEATDLTTGTKLTVHMPYALTLTSVTASLNTVSTSGTPTIDIKEDTDAEGAGSPATIFSTKPTIDANELRTSSAATASVLSDTALAANSMISFSIDTAGTGAKGLTACFIGYQ